jgi:hypothetical protein
VNREKIDSSAIRELGHDETGCEVQYHRTGCARTVKPPKGETIQAGCNCIGGDVYHHPGVPAEIHAAVVNSLSVGGAFQRYIKSPKHPKTGEPLYPHVKRATA